MKNPKCVARSRIMLLLILAIVAGCLVPIAGAQVYAYGRSDFPAVPGYVAGVVLADFNGDGRPDVAVSTSQNNLVSILLGSASGGFVAGSITSRRGRFQWRREGGPRSGHE